MVTEMSSSPKVMAGHEPLEKFCIQVLEKLSVPRDEAEITANTLVTANLRGHRQGSKNPDRPLSF